MIDDWILESLTRHGPATARGLAARMGMSRDLIAERLEALDPLLESIKRGTRDTQYRLLPRVPLDYADLDAWIAARLDPDGPPAITRIQHKKDPRAVQSGKAAARARERKRRAEKGE